MSSTSSLRSANKTFGDVSRFPLTSFLRMAGKVRIGRHVGRAETNLLTEKRITMRKQKGFSLIELLIVVAIILIIAAIAIPNLLRSRMAANEASAVRSVRTIHTAEISYNAAYPDQGFADTLTKIGSPAGACT